MKRIIGIIVIVALSSTPLYAAGWGSGLGGFSDGINQGIENVYRLQQIRNMEEQRRLIEQQRIMMEEERKRMEQQRQAIEEERRRTTDGGRFTAMDWYQKALALWVDGRLTDPERAIEYLNEAIRLKPDFGGAYNDRGVVYILYGFVYAGCNSVIKACELGECRAYEYFKQKGDCR